MSIQLKKKKKRLRFVFMVCAIIEMGVRNKIRD